MINKKALIWSLMPYVKEHLLEDNMKKESGIVRMWEDEHLNIRLR